MVRLQHGSPYLRWPTTVPIYNYKQLETNVACRELHGSATVLVVARNPTISRQYSALSPRVLTTSYVDNLFQSVFSVNIRLVILYKSWLIMRSLYTASESSKGNQSPSMHKFNLNYCLKLTVAARFFCAIYS